MRTLMVFVFTAALMFRGERAMAGDCDPAGHIDIALLVQAGQIATGVFDFNNPQQAVTVDVGNRVWGGRFHADPQDPFFADDPGFGATAGSGLPAGSQVGFNVLDDLMYWDGSGTITFSPVPNQEQLRIKLGGQNRYVGTGTGLLSGFNFAVVGGDGSIHVHLGFFLHGADGNAVPASTDGIEATPGIYLLKLELKNSNAGVARSEPLYIVFDNAAPACSHCTALNYVGSRLAHDRPAADLNFDRRVDQEDFGVFQACLTGAAVPWRDPCCQNADIDRDGDVDLTDFGFLQGCLNGPDQPADPACLP